MRWSGGRWEPGTLPLVAVLLVASLSGACGLVEDLPPLPTPGPSADNLIVNPGFEQGAEPWRAPTESGGLPFVPSGDFAKSGATSALLDLRGGENDVGTRAVGAAQDLNTTAFPEFVSGYYRVEEWEPGAESQYIEFAVTIFGGGFDDAQPWHEVRFLVAGADSEPFEGQTTRFIFLDRDAPKTGEWVYFAYPVQEAVAVKLGFMPTTWDRIQVTFEARYDGKLAGDGTATARVYLDDLYVGTQIGNPNRPDD